MKNEMLPEKESFTDKYTKTNPLTKKILKNFFDTVVSLVPSEVKTIKEIGCGAGFSTKELHEAFPAKIISGSDLDPKLIEDAQKLNPGLSFNVESIYDLQDTDNSYDLVFCLEVMEHLDEPKKALAQLKRITSKYVIISTPREPIWRMANLARGKYISDLGNTPGHINHWSKNALRKLIATEFEILEVKSPFPWTVILAKKIG
jgi:2-polyprenyl-3-methyl-5-hydroxy-6-metoxy-1,4-benzoquinol methylase